MKPKGKKMKKVKAWALLLDGYLWATYPKVTFENPLELKGGGKIVSCVISYETN